MKVTLDPIYTGNLFVCAGANKMRRLAEHLLSTHDDVFINWIVPTDMTDAEIDWLPGDARIKYWEVYERTKPDDRVKRYMQVHRWYERILSFNDGLYDTDLLVTNRATLAALQRMIMTKVGNKRMADSRKIMIIENMPIMSYKQHSIVMDDLACDIQTLSSYLAADLTAISSFWEKREAMKVARRYFSPSTVRALDEKVVEVTPQMFDPPRQKSPEFIAATVAGDKRFTISFSGRMTMRNRFGGIFDIMAKHWIMRGGENEQPLKCVITTHSKGEGRVKVPEFVDVEYSNREKFHELLQHELNVGLFWSLDEGVSMSLMEPLLHGVPLIVARAKHSIGSLGEDYPFLASSEKEAYGFIRMFYEDYAGMYERFVEWQVNKLWPMLQERNHFYVGYVADRMLGECREWYAKFAEDKKAKGVGKAVSDLHEALPVGPFKLKEWLSENRKLFPVLADKTGPEARDEYVLAFSTDWKDLTAALQAVYGYKQLSALPGHLEKPAE